MFKSTQDWFYLCEIVLFILTAITWITFARLSMARIERDMKKDGIPESFVWDGIGGRIFFYSYAIAFPEKVAKRFNRLIDVSLVRRYSNNGDWLRGVMFLATTYTWIIFTFLGIVIGIW